MVKISQIGSISGSPGINAFPKIYLRAFFSATVTIIGAWPFEKAIGATVCFFLSPGILQQANKPEVTNHGARIRR